MEKSKGRNNRTAGHNWERDIVTMLLDRSLYPHAVTARAESCSLDGEGVDIMNRQEAKNGVMDDTIQAKCYMKSLAYPTLLSRIRETGRPHPVIFHKQVGRSESKRSTGKLLITRDTFAISYLDSYVEGIAARQAITRIRALNLPGVEDILKDLGLDT